MTSITVAGAKHVIHDQAKAKGMVYQKARRHQVLQKRITGSARIPVRAGTVDDGVEFFGRQTVLTAPSRRDFDPIVPRHGAHNRRGARGQSARLDQRIDVRFSLGRKPEPVRLIPWRQMT